MTPDQIDLLFRGPAHAVMLDGFDPDSPTISGPYPCVGDCVCDEHRYSVAYVDSLSVRAGDLGIWRMPSLPADEQYACKWLVADSAGRAWLACKYFAVMYRPDFHKAVGRVVVLISGGAGTFDAPLAQRLSSEMAQLRADPPRRDDVLVFVEDLLDPASIVAEIDRRHQLS